MKHTKLIYQVVRENTTLAKAQIEKKVAKEMDPNIPMVHTDADVWQQDKDYDHLQVQHSIVRDTQEQANAVARAILEMMRKRGHDIDIYQAEDAGGNVQFSEETDEK
jgi:hypothetical protein